eukprot:TRINITY_DN6802_c0_g1_i1.p1 TRINITY_DN6802_c0_g1~~TRINITY_DN6802_c0_g1_i1.p1  ORF type:complete len:613 (+),score=133.16 TRINITY_DN6802_c0_g1_i1:3246-5084(+)
MANLKGYTRKLVEGQALSYEEAYDAVHEIMSGSASPVVVASYLTALHVRGENADIIAASAAAMRSHSAQVNGGECIDIVGTGGDCIDTFNASTAAAFVIAGAGGRIAKHGNRAASSLCGSADLLEAVGGNLDLSPQQAEFVLDHAGFVFLFAPKFHPSMKNVAPIRKELGIRTVFNFLGPLTNPSNPKYMLAGVSKKEVCPMFADSFKRAGMKRAMVVHAENGMDEISPCGLTHVWLLDGDQITNFTIRPSDFGLDEHPLEAVQGGKPAHNAVLLHKLLEGEQGPIADFVILNAAAACFVSGLARDLKHGVEIARESISSGKAKQVLEKYIHLSNVARDLPVVDASSTILEKIAAQRFVDVVFAKQQVPIEILKEKIANAPVGIDFPARLRLTPGTPVLAEVKRASPSKGDIAAGIDATAQALKYAHAGAAAISVLTEPTWFKGTLADMYGVRQGVESMGSSRPAILRKDFLLDEYQVYEARVYGADTVLLIVKMLQDEQITHLMEVSRSLGMEPLVEVQNVEEMHRAIALGSKVIGINNRNLHDFNVDLNTSERLVSLAPSDRIVIALSGINNGEDVRRFEASGIQAVLVGEALMRHSDPGQLIKELSGAQ